MKSKQVLTSICSQQLSASHIYSLGVVIAATISYDLMMLVLSITLFSALSFLYYGVHCLLSERMVAEFERFGLSPAQRRLTGALQLLGSVGLLVGLRVPLVGLIAASGLALLMGLGFLTRLKIRDGLVASLPALLFMLLNGYLAWAYAGFAG